MKRELSMTEAIALNVLKMIWRKENRVDGLVDDGLIVLTTEQARELVEDYLKCSVAVKGPIEDPEETARILKALGQ
jgi:polyhydroxyalkanoate synthesis regulator phasin